MGTKGKVALLTGVPRSSSPAMALAERPTANIFHELSAMTVSYLT
jgi:hypothetical protein